MINNACAGLSKGYQIWHHVVVLENGRQGCKNYIAGSSRAAGEQGGAIVHGLAFTECVVLSA